MGKKIRSHKEEEKKGKNQNKDLSKKKKQKLDKKETKIENMTPKERLNIKFLPMIQEKDSEISKIKKYNEKEFDFSALKTESGIAFNNKHKSNNSLQNYLHFGKKTKKENPVKLRQEIFDKDVLNISQNKKELNIEIQQPFYIEHLLKKRDKDKKKNKFV